MQNSNYNPVVVRDSRIQDVSTKLDYKISKGAAENNYQSFPAQTATVSNININVQPPSENTIIDREPTLTAKVDCKVTIPAGIDSGTRVFSYGHTEALNQFPLHSLMITSTSTVGGSSTSVSTNEILHCLLRTTDEESLGKYNTPHMPDKKYKNYSDMVLSQSNPLASFESSKGVIIPRGAHPIEFDAKRKKNNVFTDVVANHVTHNSSAAEIATALTSTASTDSWEINISFVVSEPLLFMSPFIFGDNVNNNAGLYGVKAMSFVFTLDTQCNRLFSSSTNIPMSVQLTNISDCALNFNFLSCQASDLIASKNVVPHTTYDRHLTSNIGIVAANEKEKRITSQTFAFNDIPNRIFVVCRKPFHTLKIKDSNSYWPIKNVNVSFNNKPGILCNATTHDLYRMSKRNGSKQDWYEFLGYASNPNGIQIATTGSILIIDPAKDMGLSDSMSNGMGGTFNFQIAMNVSNPEGAAIAPEILIITEHCGLFILQAGSATTESHILTSNIVVDSTMSQFGESERYINSFGEQNLLNYSASALKNIPLLNKKKASASESGGAKSGGAISGGAWV